MSADLNSLIESTIATFRNFSPENPVSNAVVYFWESHTKNPADKQKTQATIDLIYKEFDISSCEKYEVRTGYLDRYNHLSKPLFESDVQDIEAAIAIGKQWQDEWILRCQPDLDDFRTKNWDECILNNAHYENCRNLVIKKISSDVDFSNAFSKSVSEFAATHSTNEANGNLYVTEETSWLLTLPLLHLNKPIYLIHIGSANSAVAAMFHHFPNLQRAVKWLSPRFSVSIFENISDFLLDYRNATHVGHSYARENKESIKAITLLKNEKDSAKNLYLMLENERARSNLLLSIIGKIPTHLYWLNRDNVYLGCNDIQAQRLGLNSQNDVIGKTNYDLHIAKEAEELNKINDAVMQTGISYEGEELASFSGKLGNYLSRKTPLFDLHGKIIGLLGISIDITDRKKAEQLELENKLKESFKILADQVMHDITSPLIALSSFAQSCEKLSEKDHITLRNIVTSIESICKKLLEKYEKPIDRSAELYISPYLSLLAVVGDKNIGKEPNITFNYSHDSAHYFIFISGDYSDFCRMISNLLNNSVEAVEKGKKGIVDVSFTVRNRNVEIRIKDNGKGMPQEVVDKILNDIPVSASKQGGHGIGMRQIRQTLQAMNGQMSIKSTENVGTEITLVFPECDPPKWFSMEITLRKGDTVVALDDDPSILDIWKRRFEKYSDEIAIKYFTQAQEAIDFINSLQDKSKLLLLTDYDLRDQRLNGVEVIEKSRMQNRSIVVTSAYISKIKEFNEKIDFIKLIPKSYVDKIPIATA